MSAKEIPPEARSKHDPNAGLQGTWTIPFTLDPGETLIGPVSVTAVDETDEPLSEAEPIEVLNVSLGQISVTPNRWGVSFDTEGGTVRDYLMRAAAQRTNGVRTWGTHRTVLLVSKHG